MNLLNLNGRDRAVADALTADGFSYCGYEDDFCESPGLEAVGNWEIGGTYQAPGFDVVYDGRFLFCKDYSENFESLTQEEFDRIKRLISRTQLAWDTCANAGQLSLPGVG